MKIKLSNGVEINPLIVIGEKRNIQNAHRDALSFVFPADSSLDELDSTFTEAACEKIVITDEKGDEYIYNAYTVRAELRRSPVEVSPATESQAAVYENRAIVTMAQRTYQESQMNEMREALELILSGATGEEA